MELTRDSEHPLDTPDYLDDAFDPETHLTSHERADWVTQQKFLARYAGTIRSGMASKNYIPVVRRTVQRWLAKDYLGFGRRRLEAHQHYVDGLEDKSTSLIDALKPGQNPIALTVRLNAELPEKYRQPSSDLADATKEALGKWTAVARSMLARAQVTEPQAPGAIEGEAREAGPEAPGRA